ncbi:hypothetical protein G7Y89_g2158 [Cudoniella acicularis]|uniref:Uncharacterized protein n=1 Tax=Cudoniella acicularis TaxID=354080 RepID=A0A8H4W781_9HELO|nr:hypothetical protein G7Y89_g2158 [Cudoniella acicularis]
MDQAIGASLEIIKAIHLIVSSLQKTPDFVETISSHAQQLCSILEALHRKSETQVLDDEEMKAWLTQQLICNTMLCRIKDILDRYARGTTGKFPLLNLTRFQFGGDREKLMVHMEDLKDFVRVFVVLSGMVLSEAPSEQALQPNNNSHVIRRKEPAMSISQIVQMQRSI